MPYPTVYDITYSYTGFAQSLGDGSFPGPQIDNDFAGLQQSLENLTSFVSGVARSDGALQNGVVTYDSLAPSLQTAGLAPAAAWLTATLYPKDANTVINAALYRATVEHLSGVFATDLGAGRWTKVADLPTQLYTAGAGLALASFAFSVSGVTTAMFAANVVDVDGTLAANSDTRVPTQKAVKTYADNLLAASDAMIFKGVIDCSANPNYPAADRGWTYKVSVAGKIGGASGNVVEVGDTLMCTVDGSASGTQAAVGANWAIVQVNIDGAVVGPASSTSGNIATFSGVSGKLIQDGGKALPAGAIVGTTDAQVLTNKTFDSAGTGNVMKVSGVTVSAGQFPAETGSGAATAGNIGEYAESEITAGSAISIVTNTPKDLTTIAIGAGDWEVDAVLNYLFPASTSFTAIGASLSATLNTVDATKGRFCNQVSAANVPGNGVSATVVIPRRKFTGPATIHLVGLATFTVSTLQMYGIVTARRPR